MCGKYMLALALVASMTACTGLSERDDYNLKTRELAESFVQPPLQYGPYVWWHWMGSNFSKEGIRKDLEAMKESGIAGATIFNLTSAVQESQFPIENNPWPEQTYRSDAYWDAMEYAASLIGEDALKKSMTDPWINDYLADILEVFGRTSTDSMAAIPRFICGDSWVVPDADDVDGLTQIIRQLTE